MALAWPCACRYAAARSPSGPQDPRLPIAFGRQDGGSLGAFGGQDLGLPGALGGEDHRPLLAVGAHLLLHRVLNRRRRIDAVQFDAGHPQVPAAGGLVEDPAQLGVDLVAAGQSLFQRHPADHVAQGGGGELLDADDVVADLVDRGLRIATWK